ncbi:efflux RND transporter periplasmic adaptor subunit [Desulfatitalea tepidiphila]|uniref:efflux RND transporter periplasmic adaptor subunit n=1 Tax=Desulfatitalea tepidiphila TaxID=1185843 RepID=UPI0006B418F8|nr:efflux RND transporter periplasmic adaptor subunit [Desulfatitalea tepidiphila]
MTLRSVARWLIVAIIVVAIALWIWTATRPEPVKVVLKPVTRGTVAQTVANTRAGTIEACRRAKLSPSTGGQIAYLPIKEGDTVKTGQLLLELWNEDLKAQAVLAEREVTAARSRARATCLKADAARRSADRLVALRKKDVVSQDQTENAVADATALEAECRARTTEIGVLEAKVAVTRANIRRTQLTAPFDGVIAAINGELFEFVTPSPIGIPTPPAVDIIDNACFYVTAPIDEVDAAAIRVGMTANVTLDAFREKQFQGQVRRIADYVLDIEKQARTVDVEVAFSRPEDFKHLLAGYSADIEVTIDVRHDVLRVPTEAVLDGRRVFVFHADEGRISARSIQTGLSNWDWTEVAEGLTTDEQVVVNVDAPGIEDGAAAVLIEATP